MADTKHIDAAALRAIQRKLDAWELEHLREHAAALYLQLESANAQIEQLQSELVSADARADMFHALLDQAQDIAPVRIGITREGQMGVLQ